MGVAVAIARSWLGALVCCATYAHGAEPAISLAAAAREIASRLPAGQIVTTEKVGEKTEVSVAGHREPAEVAPERVLFEIGSITKVFTSLLLAQATVEGKVTLDTTVADILGPEVKFEDARVGAITLRQLATHRSGLPRLPADLALGADPTDPYAHYSRERLLAGLAGTKLAGTAPFPFSYSNLGAAVLGELLARVYGQPWDQLIAEKITAPLGLRDTVPEPNDEQQHRHAPPYQGADRAAAWHLNSLRGAGALHSTAHDLLLFGEALLHPEMTPLRDAIALLLKPQTKEGDIGLAIMISELDGQRVYEHGGGTGGYRSDLQLTPATETIRVVLINNSTVEGAQVIAATRHEKPRTAESNRVLSETELNAYAGIYKLDENASFTVLRRGAELWSRLTGQAFFRLYPHETADRFFLKVVPAEMQFERADGQIGSVTLFQNGHRVPAKKTDTPPPALRFRTPSELKEFAGTYELAPSAVFTLKVTDITLFAQLTGQTFLPVFESKPDWFEYDVVPAALEFERADDGHITALKLHQNGAIQRAVRKP